MQKSRIIITLLVICPEAAARGNDHRGRPGAGAKADAEAETEVEARAVSNGARLNYNLVASHLLCYFVYLFLWMRISGCPLTSSHLQKLAVVFICFCGSRQLVVVVVRSVNLFSFCCLWIFALALSSASCTNRSRARHKTFMAVLFSFWSRKKRRCLLLWLRGEWVSERERERERGNIGSNRARPELCVGHWPLAAAAAAHRNYMMMYVMYVAVPVHVYVHVYVCVCACEIPHMTFASCRCCCCCSLAFPLNVHCLCASHVCDMKNILIAWWEQLKAKAKTESKSKLKATLVATHACNTLHKQRINQATRRDANVAITWSQTLNRPCLCCWCCLLRGANLQYAVHCAFSKCIITLDSLTGRRSIRALGPGLAIRQTQGKRRKAQTLRKLLI